ncbi:MAG: RHS repeat-associated core domain-containing protein [Pseudomonadota bacterium]
MVKDLGKRPGKNWIKTVQLLFLLFISSYSQADELVGSDGGSISVGNSGQATWSMPVEVPSGINGLAPNLTLSVSSTGGNGILGIGGGLSGLSAISRCGRTVHQDGYFQAPQFQQTDAYCLDGARLVLETGTYGAAGSVYRTEIESFQRIRAHESVAGKGPAYFEVTNRNGATTFYGKRSSTRDVDSASSAVAVWKVDQLVDSNSNTLHYHYGDVSGNNEIQLTHITYGGNVDMGVAENLRVQLIYEDRPDTFTSWSRGQEYSQTKRVSRIQTKVGTTLVKNYRLFYEQGAISNASRLKEIQLCAGNNNCYRPSQFEYAPETEADWTASSLALPAAAQTVDGKPLGILIDINNDGRSDWVTAYKSAAGSVHLETFLGTNSGWQASNDFKLPDVMFDYFASADGFAKGMLMDVDGDGWPEYVQAYQSDAGVVTQTWPNNGTSISSNPDPDLALPTALVSLQSDGSSRSLADVADLNADGLIDVLQSVQTASGVAQTSWLQTATWNEQTQQNNHAWPVSTAYKARSIATDFTQGTKGRVLATLQDVNADGLVDWVQSYRVNGTTSNVTWLNNGQGFDPVASAAYSLPDTTALFNYDLTADGVAEYTFSDVNGDGLPDLSKALQIDGIAAFDSWIHTGLTWQQDPSYKLPAASTLVSESGEIAIVGGLIDLNSDGQPEFVLSYQNATTTVEGFWEYDQDSQIWDLSSDYGLPFINNQIQADGSGISSAEGADLNHDGYPELINTLTGATYETTQGSEFPGSLVRTVNPLGAVTELTYGISTDDALYELAPKSAYPNVAVNSPSRLVSEVAASDGIGGMISALHKYGKAKANVLGQGGLGYEYHAMQDGVTGVIVTTVFHQTYPFAGRVKSSSKVYGDKDFSESSSEMELKTITRNGLSTLYPHPNSSWSKTYDLDGNLIKTTESTSEIDDFGNATLSIESIFDAAGNLVRRSTKDVDYKAPDLTRWLLGLPETVTSTIFDQATGDTFTNVAVAEFYADGKPKNETLEPNSSQWVKKAYTYDEFGNRTSSTITAGGIAEARTSTTTFTSDGRFPETVKNALNHTITSTFDAILGKPRTVTDANGITKEFLYDGFGTVVKETKAHQDNGATRGRQIVVPKWCNEQASSVSDGENGQSVVHCPNLAVYFIAAFDDEGEAPEIAYYDINGRELRRQTYGFQGKIIVVETEYNATGKVASVTQPYYKEEQIDPVPRTEYEYDVLGREVQRKNAEGSLFFTRYNYLTVETENPGNEDTAPQITKVINNLFGQPIESIDPDQNSTKYQYDGRGKLVKTTDSQDNFATITYDPIFGRKEAMNDPDLGAWSYEYDSLGNLVAQTDAIGQRTEMTYDVLNRLVRRVDDVGGDKEEITTWDYSETNGNGNVIGGLSRVTSPGYERTVKYDDLSRVVEATSTINGDPFTQRTGYLGTADKVDWIEYPSGLSVRNTYDDYGFPKTVEGITLDYDKYLQFQVASRQLNDLQRQLEAYKDENLTDQQLFDLEEHERQVRLLGTALSEFYDEFETNPTKEQHEDDANHYSELVGRVQQKLTQHGNWYNIYQEELEDRYDNIKDDLARLEVIPGLSAPHESAYNTARALHDSYVGQVNHFAERINTHVGVINHHLGNAQAARIHVNNLIDSLYWPEQAVRYKIPENMDMSGIEVMVYDLDCCTQHVINNFMKTQNGDLILSHQNQINNWLGVITTSFGHMEHHQQIIDDNQYQYWYDYYETRRASEATKMANATAAINQYAAEANTLNTRVQPDLDRINNWLVPLTQSHNNVILSFSDRARAYAIELSKLTGSYAVREDLKSENFLRPFKNHVEYARCLRDQGNKSTGDCYAENLVHVLNDDGSVDTTKQSEARDKIDSTELVDVKQFWSTNRFFCSVYYGYSCPSMFRDEIKQVAKTIHTRQCARMTTAQKADSSVPCETSKWNDTYVSSNDGNTYPKYSYLVSAVAEVSNSLNDFYAALVSKHQAEVERLVTNATNNTYNAETDYHDIIQPGGDLWQATTPTDVEVGDVDPRDYVLLYKGEVQLLAYDQMDSVAREADRDLKGHQFGIAQLISGGDAAAYEALYLAVQDKAEEVDTLYKEIDQAYALASDDDEFDDNVFNETKKIYWQAEDINSKGQIKRAKYGNGTVTEWSYDQFGRINGHFTQNANGQTLLSNTYEFDAIGNLIQRVDNVEDLTEDFTYDQLNRLVQNDLSGTAASMAKVVQQNVVEYDYDDLGNLTYKSDIYGGGVNGQYIYGQASGGQHAGPHAVTSVTGLGSFTYDANGNQLTGNGRTVIYNAYNKPTRITKAGKDTRMWYGPERQLVQQQQPTPQGLETTKYVGALFEQINTLGQGVVNRHHIAVAGSAIAVVETQPGSLVATKESYLHKNHQSSVLAISDANGEIAERRYFDAFGDIKSYIGQTAGQYSSWVGYVSATTMAFTGHRTMVAAGVIHMGGRVYDAAIGRFLSADPHIQAPLNSQSLNRYSYTINNPLSFTDPSGYIFKSILKSLKKLFNKIKNIIKKVLNVVKKVLKTIAKVVKKIGQFIKKYARVIVAVVAAVAVAYFAPQIFLAAGANPGVAGGLLQGTGALTIKGAVAAGALAGGVSGLVATGSIKGALKGAFFGAVTGGFARYVNLQAAAKIDSLGTIVKDSANAAVASSIRVAANIKLVAGHALIGGARAVVNGGKFLAGAISAGVGKILTIGINGINTIKSSPLAQGLLVAAAGGIASSLAGGSFELGFLTAGLAFAVNHVLDLGATPHRHDRLSSGGFKSKRAAFIAAGRAAKKYANDLGVQDDVGVNIWLDDDSGLYGYSFPSVGRAVARLTHPPGSLGGDGGEYAYRNLEGHTLVGIHVHLHGGFSPEAFQTGGMAALSHVHDVDIIVRTHNPYDTHQTINMIHRQGSDSWGYQVCTVSSC